MRTLTLFLGGLLALSSMACGQTIDVGTYSLLPNTADQKIELFVTGGTEIEAVNLNVQIADGMSGPVLQSVDLRSDTIFDPLNEGQLDILTNPQLFATTVTTPFSDPPTTVAANGLLATLTVDTTGFSSGVFDLRLSGTLNGDSDFGFDLAGSPLPANVTNGQLLIVPEPTSIGLTAVALFGLACMRYQRRHNQ